jgi:hypothetical protein
MLHRNRSIGIGKEQATKKSIGFNNIAYHMETG